MKIQSTIFFIFLILTNSINSLSIKLDSRAQSRQIQKVKSDLINSECMNTGSDCASNLQYIYDRVEELLKEARAQQEKHNELQIQNYQQCKNEEKFKDAKSIFKNIS